MPYMLLIVETQGQRRARGPEQGEAVYARMLKYAADLKSKGVLLSSNSLRTEAVRFDRHDGRPQLLDGPFTETKELIGGFFYLNCDTREQALAFADACPAAEWATIEVRETGPCFE